MIQIILSNPFKTVKMMCCLRTVFLPSENIFIRNLFSHYLVILTISVLCSWNSASCQEWPVYPYNTHKKIIEFGWDLPSAQFVRNNITSMEQRPFDGLIFSSGSKIPLIFNPVDFKTRVDIVDTSSLYAIQWKKFTDNFLVIWSGDTDSMSYFNEAQWRKINSNMRLIAKAAKNSHCKGINFDTEFYSKRSPWGIAEHSEGHTQAELCAKVRQRGREVMQAWQSEFPDIIVLCQFVFMYVPERWELLPYFMNGMLEAAGPKVRIIEGDEESYYWGATNKWFDRYNEIKKDSRNLRCDTSLYRKYDRQVQVGKSLYDAKIIYDKHKPNEKSKRWEHNVYMGLITTDEYVWGYFEYVNWWGTSASDQPMGNVVTDPPPAWIENGMRGAQLKYKNRNRLGWDMTGEVWSEGNIDSTLSIKTISPRQGEQFMTKQHIGMVTEIVNTGDTAISRVDFYINMNKVGQANNAPWTFLLDNLPEGTYDIVARAHAGARSTGTSAPIRIIVKQEKK